VKALAQALGVVGLLFIVGFLGLNIYLAVRGPVP